MPNKTNSILETPIEYLKGVGPVKADLLKKELGIFTCMDLLQSYPFRHIDKTKFHKINEINTADDFVQIKGVLNHIQIHGNQRKRRLTAQLRDATGSIELVWFKGVTWLEKNLQSGVEHIVYGKINYFNGRYNIPHPELSLPNDKTQTSSHLAPIYHSSEKLNNKGLDSKGRRKIIYLLLQKLTEVRLEEHLPAYIMQKLKLMDRHEAMINVHFPKNELDLKQAVRRIKFDEVFYFQLRMSQLKAHRVEHVKGLLFDKVGDLFNTFYKEFIPFELTGAQKRVIKEIRNDLGSGIHMNRLLQGDVGSGKTMVGLLSMLIALDNGFQACMIAPTEILAKQHYTSLHEDLGKIDVVVGYLSGSVKGKKRKLLLAQLEAGEIHILIGTHAVLEDPVVFKNLGLAITDEQHRFGVKQRSKLWKKNISIPPHILVMTATPIPRTLAMTAYGDLDVSKIDEMPPGRKSITTMHKKEENRLYVFGFMRKLIAQGRQIYIVYPLIEESATLDLNNLMQGYESLERDFPKPEYQISVVHGRMKTADKDYEMQRFVRNETQIMIATTVIEVGVNVPNASLMIIENTERFGLSQLHQLRGRVGRGSDKSYCILMSKDNLSKESFKRIQTMVRTTDGFEIAEADLKLRGPGSIDGTMQSGMNMFKLTDIIRDGEMIRVCREMAIRIFEKDPNLSSAKHEKMRSHLEQNFHLIKGWSRIS